MTFDIWHLAFELWHETFDMWHLKLYSWHMTLDIWFDIWDDWLILAKTNLHWQILRLSAIWVSEASASKNSTYITKTRNGSLLRKWKQRKNRLNQLNQFPTIWLKNYNKLSFRNPNLSGKGVHSSVRKMEIWKSLT